MYIPYEIGDTCYFYAEEGTLARGVIKAFNVSDKTTVRVESQDLQTMLGLDLDISRIYPTKAILKEELLRRSVNYANEKLADL